jgi:hypothetical protein
LGYLCFIDLIENAVSIATYHHHGNRWYEEESEMIREELQSNFVGFGVSAIHSEYGMTELLSQAYSLGNGVFECPAWMQILVRDTEDALTYIPDGKTGGINVIDLANINSCSFIATQDLGKKNPNNSFEVLGRLIIRIFEVVI